MTVFQLVQRRIRYWFIIRNGSSVFFLHKNFQLKRKIIKCFKISFTKTGDKAFQVNLTYVFLFVYKGLSLWCIATDHRANKIIYN